MSNNMYCPFCKKILKKITMYTSIGGQASYDCRKADCNSNYSYCENNYEDYIIRLNNNDYWINNNLNNSTGWFYLASTRYVLPCPQYFRLKDNIFSFEKIKDILTKTIKMQNYV